MLISVAHELITILVVGKKQRKRYVKCGRRGRASTRQACSDHVRHHVATTGHVEADLAGYCSNIIFSARPSFR